jgi:hypothetical protein
MMSFKLQMAPYLQFLHYMVSRNCPWNRDLGSVSQSAMCVQSHPRMLDSSCDHRSQAALLSQGGSLDPCAMCRAAELGCLGERGTVNISSTYGIFYIN